MKKILKYCFGLFILLIFFIISVNFYVLSFSKSNYYKNISHLEKNEIGLVFGAAIINNDIPTDILKDRLKVAYKTYNLGKIKKIIVSGATDIDYSEPDVMKKYLVQLGVDADNIYTDYAGLDTYDSLYRVKHIFGVENIVLFTQDFHLKRAIYISKKLGIETYGVETNIQKYLSDGYNDRREVLARIKAFLDVEIFSSKSKYLGEKIVIEY